MDKKWKIIKDWSTRAGVFYVIVILLSLVLIDYDKGKAGLAVRYLEKKVPKPELMISKVEAEGIGDKNYLASYIKLYQYVIEYKPKSADAYSMLGFSLYYSGDIWGALEAYKKAAELRPNVFWFYYNQAIINFNNKDYETSLTDIDQALKTDSQKTLEFVASSRRIYRPLLGKIVDESKVYQDRLLFGMHNVYRLKVLNHIILNQYEEAQSAIVKALKLNTPYSTFHQFYAGIIAYINEDYEKALSLFTLSLQTERPYDGSFDNIEKCLLILDRKEKLGSFRQLRQQLFDNEQLNRVKSPQANYNLRVF